LVVVLWFEILRQPWRTQDDKQAWVRLHLGETNMAGPTKVEIFGQMYSIQGDLDAAYVQKLATFVDEKMQTIADATQTVDTQKVAVLAALAIADELHSSQREIGEREEMLKEQAERCLTLVERALKQTA
jgi:cell division protein ZapA